jgi:uncharacterized membrane protein YidH (DUF202 family)
MSDDSKVEGSKTDPRVSFAEDRTEMATFRTSLSLDRTTLAWVRTTLAMSSFGLGIIGFFRTVREQAETAKTIRMHEGAIHFGLALVVIGVVSTVLSRSRICQWSGNCGPERCLCRRCGRLVLLFRFCLRCLRSADSGCFTLSLLERLGVVGDLRAGAR